MKGLTNQQRKVLAFIRERAEKRGIPPSYGEIGLFLEVTKASAMNHVEALRKKGMLSPSAGKRRDIWLTDEGRAMLCGNG